MSVKNLLPLRVRNALRPSYQRWARRWRESAYSPKPADWLQKREQLLDGQKFESLLRFAGEEFGITQKQSEAHRLIDLVQADSPRTIVEVGTHKGGNSFLFCRAITGADRVIGIDLCVQNAAKLKYFAAAGQRYVAHHGSSQCEEMRDRVVRSLGGRKIDFLFIDGDHSYQGAKRDFELYSPLVKPGGLIAFHDICPDHKTLYGRDTGCYAGEVYKLWRELRPQYPEAHEFVDEPDQDGFGIGVLRTPVGSSR